MSKACPERSEGAKHGGTIINVMDDGRAAAKKEKPKRATMVLVSFFLSMAASVIYVIAVYRYDEPLKRMRQIFVNRKAQEKA